jgi:hypothetical protein
VHVSEGILSKVAILVAQGRADDLRAYVAHVLPRERELAPIRDAMARSFTAPFLRLARELAPWIDDDVLPREGLTPEGRIRQLLAAAGTGGLARSELGLSSWSGKALDGLVEAGDVVRARVKTAGRPAERFYLKEHSAGVLPIDHDRNPFALTVPKV